MYVFGIEFVIVADGADCTNSSMYLSGPIVFIAAVVFASVGYVLWGIFGDFSVHAGEKEVSNFEVSVASVRYSASCASSVSRPCCFICTLLFWGVAVRRWDFLNSGRSLSQSTSGSLFRGVDRRGGDTPFLERSWVELVVMRCTGSCCLWAPCCGLSEGPPRGRV